MPKYPDVFVKLVGEDGNAYAILARSMKAMRRAGKSEAQIDEFLQQAQSGDYAKLLMTCTEFFEVA